MAVRDRPPHSCQAWCYLALNTTTLSIYIYLEASLSLLDDYDFYK